MPKTARVNGIVKNARVYTPAADGTDDITCHGTGCRIPLEYNAGGISHANRVVIGPHFKRPAHGPDHGLKCEFRQAAAMESAPRIAFTAAVKMAERRQMKLLLNLDFGVGTHIPKARLPKSMQGRPSLSGQGKKWEQGSYRARGARDLPAFSSVLQSIERNGGEKAREQTFVNYGGREPLPLEKFMIGGDERKQAALPLTVYLKAMGYYDDAVIPELENDPAALVDYALQMQDQPKLHDRREESCGVVVFRPEQGALREAVAFPRYVSFTPAMTSRAQKNPAWVVSRDIVLAQNGPSRLVLRQGVKSERPGIDRRELFNNGHGVDMIAAPVIDVPGVYYALKKYKNGEPGTQVIRVKWQIEAREQFVKRAPELSPPQFEPNGQVRFRF